MEKETERLITILQTHWPKPNDDLVNVLFAAGCVGAHAMGWSAEYTLGQIVLKLSSLYPDMSFTIGIAGPQPEEKGVAKNDKETIH